MARRTDHSREELAELVVGAAETLARREGLRGIAMRRIAAEIGYAAGSIYNAVGDLDAVVLRVNARTLERLRAALVRLVDPARPPIENALAVADGYLDFVARQPRLWGVILEHVLPPGSDFPTGREGARGDDERRRRGLKPLVADEDERRRAVATLWASLHGLASLSSSGKLAVVDRDDPRAMAHLLIRRFLGGAASPAAEATLTAGPNRRRHRTLIDKRAAVGAARDMAMYRDARRLLVAAVLALSPSVAAAQGTAANPSAAASDIRSPSSTNPAAAASDIRNPSATNPAAAASDLRATAVPAQGGAPAVGRRQTFAPADHPQGAAPAQREARAGPQRRRPGGGRPHGVAGEGRAADAGAAACRGQGRRHHGQRLPRLLSPAGAALPRVASSRQAMPGECRATSSREARRRHDPGGGGRSGGSLRGRAP